MYRTKKKIKIITVCCSCDRTSKSKESNIVPQIIAIMTAGYGFISCQRVSLTLSMLRANSAGNKVMTCLFFPESRI